MLAGLADFTLSYSESYITLHPGPIPLELQLGDYPLDPCVGLSMGIPDQLSAYGSRADHPLLLRVSTFGGQCDSQQTILPGPQRVPAFTEQPELGAFLSQLFLAGPPPFLLGPIHVGYYPREAFLEFLQLCNVIGQHRVSTEVLYHLRIPIGWSGPWSQSTPRPGELASPYRNVRDRHPSSRY